MSEKTEHATPYKLQKAKEKGQVSKSLELTTSMTLLMILMMISALWAKQTRTLCQLLHDLFENSAHIQLSIDTVSQLFHSIFNTLLSLWIPFAITTILTVVLSTIAQTGIVWSAVPLVPDFKRMHPINGLKRIVSIKTLFEAGKNTVKLSAAILFLYISFKHHMPFLLKLEFTHPHHSLSLIMQFILNTLFQLTLILITLASVDKFYTLKRFKKENRMSKHEVKDEIKQREGDPKIKNKIKQLQLQLRQKTASLNYVKTADVIITNPTHLAIALKYDRITMPAPKVICKGEGEMVSHIKKIANTHSIPIIEHKIFARLLYHSIGLNQSITSDLFPMAAPIFRDIYTQRSVHES